MKIGLVLEGGGVKGAYHCGVVKTLLDNGYSFDGVSGTSIGAINGAFIVQDNGNTAVMERFWNTINLESVLDVKDVDIASLLSKEKDNYLKYYLNYFTLVKKNIGIAGDTLLRLLNEFIDEDKIRNSKLDFSLTTFSITERKPQSIDLEDIPQGKLVEYLFASAYCLGFKPPKIGEQLFIDGGVYDNMPINPLLSKGYNRIVVVRTNRKKPRTPALIRRDAKISYITPSEYLGHAFNIDFDAQKNNFHIGVMDAKRFLFNYGGDRFYFSDKYNLDWEYFWNRLSPEQLNRIEDLLDPLETITIRKKIYSFNKRIKIFDEENSIEHKFFKTVERHTGRKSNNISLAVMNLLEHYAMFLDIEKTRLYTYQEFLQLLKNKVIESINKGYYYKKFVFDELFYIIFMEGILENEQD